MKLVVAGLIAAIRNDKDQHRYHAEYRLVRADSLGVWVEILDEILTGSGAQFLDQEARPTQIELTRNVSDGTWQATAVKQLSESLKAAQLDADDIPNRVQAKRWFKDFVYLRNGTRGHGAPSAATKGLVCSSLERSIVALAENLPLLRLPWAYLYQNLSGKYRVTTWGVSDEKFEQLKRDTKFSYNNGVYICLDEIRRVSLVDSDSEGLDYWFANGNFTETRYEMLSYLTNNRDYKLSGSYMLPAEDLPVSETQGLGGLTTKGKTFTNIPEPVGDYVPREELERDLTDQLLDLSRHFIVTLTGRGGIGKTSTALRAITALVESDSCPYDVIVWFSARDVDLMESGPKPVRPHGVSIADFSEEYANLLEPGEMYVKGFKAQTYLADQLAGNGVGPTLFVFDNFETTTAPVEIFNWLDTHVRQPNKVLITSRDRRFTGDYVLPVHGMTHAEADELIRRTVSTLKIEHKMTSSGIEELIQESDGHPYIIKLMLGEMARSKAASPERIMAGHNEALTALFERSYHGLSRAAERVFLTLCNWKSSVPSIALEAVLLRPENERIDVQSAIQELVQSSFIEEAFDDISEESEVNVPLAARLFGLQKAEVSLWRGAIEKDVSLLHLLGAQAHGATSSLDLRIRHLFENVADAIARGNREFSEVRPVLEFITSRHSLAAIWLADLVAELDLSEEEEEKYLLQYVQGQENANTPAWEIWRRIADMRRSRQDTNGELDALAQVCRREGTPARVLSNTANRINTSLRERAGQVAREEKQYLIRDVVGALENCKPDLDATDLSRLAWLQMHLDEVEAALDTVRLGLRLDPYNQHCQRLQSRLTLNARNGGG